MMKFKQYAWSLIALFLFAGQTAFAAADEVPVGGDSIFPWIMVGLTILSVVVSAIWMKRGGRF